MAKEIERKYLVTGEFKNDATGSFKIIQGYLSHNSERIVRVRIRDERAFITIKGKQTGITRYEWEKEISVSDASELLKLCLPHLIEKRRYIVPAGIHIIEVDEFFGLNSGLIIAETELRSEEELVKLPPWIGKEVSQDMKYHNSSLSINPYTEWK
ncbi:MAG: CYTH domain-containing protein [Bacteroidales bacterium]|nr:CYTH domain-containing protein [Bacteroidales bacterium]